MIDPNKFSIIAGPCVLEDYQMSIDIALHMKDVCETLGYNYIFKGSFCKANRTSKDSFRGIEFKEAIHIFNTIKENNILVTTDVHECYQMTQLKNFIDIIQIPAYLCRQTDLLECAGSTFSHVNIKKGQFAAPETMEYAAEKVYQYHSDAEHKYVWLTERGTTFGYNDLVVDMRNIEIIKLYCDCVIFDVTHSCQKPGGTNSTTGGDSRAAGVLTRCAIAAGCHGLFMEVHPTPAKAKSDASTQMPLARAEGFLKENTIQYIQEINVDSTVKI